MNTETHGKRVWAGDPSTVADARTAYAREPSDDNLIQLAVDLYSFRYKQRFAAELLWLRSKLRAYAERFLYGEARPSDPLKAANRAETVATHLRWILKQREVGEDERQVLRALVRNLLEAGTGLIKDLTHHTPYLLALGEAQLYFDEHGTLSGHFLQLMRKWARTAHLIAEAEQRARVYRTLGMLYRKSGAWLTGYQWGIRACFVPNVPLAVTVKSVAALLGIER